MVDEDAQRDRKENGPRDITKAHATCVPMESKASHDPLAYRVLFIMSRIYRKLATMRLKHLEKWIQTPEFQGRELNRLGGNFPHVWNTGGQSERKQQGEPRTSTNALARVVRPLMYMTASIAGMPSQNSQAIHRSY